MYRMDDSSRHCPNVGTLRNPYQKRTWWCKAALQFLAPSDRGVGVVRAIQSKKQAIKDSVKSEFRISVSRKQRITKHKTARHLYICDFHKNLIQSVRNRRKRKGSDDDGDSPVQDVDAPEVDLYQLQVNTLRRYKRHFKLQTRPGLNKAQLVEIIGCHFRTIPVNEKDTLTYFIYSVKNDKNKADLKMDSGVH
ncbi:PREDICTED: histone deacetylase complex subunit SAP30 [Charadrius vociferus]|nr:PREDICTED: histone deacetylase complex subunit SAP30 [Charadrius vociferus]